MLVSEFALQTCHLMRRGIILVAIVLRSSFVPVFCCSGDIEQASRDELRNVGFKQIIHMSV